MKRLLKSLLTSALLASAPTVFAQSAANGQPCGWTKLGEAESGGFDYYIDYCKIVSSGRHRSAWIMTDYQVVQKDVGGLFYQSDAVKYAVDCQQSRSAITALYGYHARMGKGPVVYSESIPQSQWKFSDPPPSSIGVSHIETICR
jgi:hypothetical protein